MAVSDASDKIENLLQKAEHSGVCATLCRNLQDENFVASQVKRTGGNRNNNALQLAIRQN